MHIHRSRHLGGALHVTGAVGGFCGFGDGGILAAKMSGKRTGGEWGSSYAEPAAKKKKETKIERIMRQVRFEEDESR